MGEEQRLWRETARRFLDKEAPVGHARALIGDHRGYDPTLYRRMAELGWMAAMAPENSGGGSVSGHPVADAAVVAEELGRTLTPAPVLEVNLSVLALRVMARTDERRRIGPLVSGATTASLAVLGPTGDGWNAAADGLVAEPIEGGRWRLTGTRTAVAFGLSVDTFLATARGPGGPMLFLVPAATPGLQVVRLESFDLTRLLARLDFEGVALGPEAALTPGPIDPTVLGAWLAAAAALQTAETTGALARVAELSVEYAKTRRAFGRAIGSFQAVKHRLADMTLWLEWARAASALAVSAADQWLAGGPAAPLMEATGVAKVVIGEFAPTLVRSAIQVHGGIGYTWEHDAHLYLRRVEANGALWGTTDFHRDRLAEHIGFSEPVAV